MKAHSQNCKIKSKLESGKKAAIESQFFCDHCGRKFSKNYRLIEHVAVVHTKELKIECDFCGKSFTTKESLQHHLVLRHENKALECKKCKLTFIDKGEMKTHMLSFHSSKEPTFNCTKCSKQFGFIKKNSCSIWFKNFRNTSDHLSWNSKQTNLYTCTTYNATGSVAPLFVWPYL